jgi:hypothetical protein
MHDFADDIWRYPLGHHPASPLISKLALQPPSEFPFELALVSKALLKRLQVLNYAPGS